MRSSAILVFVLGVTILGLRPFDALASDEWGSIKGRLVWGRKQLPETRKVSFFQDAKECQKGGNLFEARWSVHKKSRGVSGVFVYLVKPSRVHSARLRNPYGEKPKTAKLSVRELDKALKEGFDISKVKPWGNLVKATHCRFEPNSIGLLKSDPLVLLNGDRVRYSIRISAREREYPQFDLQHSSARSVRLDKSAYPIRVWCTIHPWMSLRVMAFDHPYFAVTDQDGSFFIKNVPAGANGLRMFGAQTIDPISGASPAKVGALTRVNVKESEVLDLGTIRLTTKAR